MLYSDLDGPGAKMIQKFRAIYVSLVKHLCCSGMRESG